MPNYVENRLTITGPNSVIRRFINQAYGGKKDDHFEFERFFPIPTELEAISKVYFCKQKVTDAVLSKIKLVKKRQKKKFGHIIYKSDCEITKKQSNELKSKFGADNWYDWALIHWGTKSGAFDTFGWDVVDGLAEVNYVTAWSPASAFFVNVSKLFPELTFKHEFAEGGLAILGWETFENGVTLQSVSLDWDSKEGKILRESFGYDDEEEE